MNAEPAPPRLFILSPRRRDELLARLGALGWPALSARRGDEASGRFARSGARVALIDRLGMRDVDRAHVRALSITAERVGGALVALTEDADADAALDDGATQLLDADADDAALLRALRLAERHSDRVRAAWPVEAIQSPRAAPAWAYRPGTREVELSPALARAAGLGTEEGRRVSLLELFRKLDGEGRRAARGAVERLQSTGEATAFAHGAEHRRFAHHLGLGADLGTVVGWVESPDAGEGVPVTVGLEGDIDDALQADGAQIEIVFQPQVAVSTGRVEGVEALARWRHPRLGQLDATTLFSAAGRAGRGPELSRRVQDLAFQAVARWPAALKALRVSVNVTAGDLGKPDFVPTLRARLADLGIDHRRITIEITESELIADLAIAAGRLAALREAGLRVAIDDFGTGYSSLAYLKALPLDYLKIDKALAQDIAGSPRDRVVIRGVIDMARALGLAVVAEGVETDQQLDLLAAEGCTLYQGYLFSPALPSEALAQLLASETVPA